MKRLPLLWVLMIPILVSITIGFGAFAFYIDSVERANRIADIDDELGRAERSTPPRLEPGEGVPAPSSDESSGVDDPTLPVQFVLSADGQVLGQEATSLFSDETLAALASGSAVQTLDEPRYRVRSTPARDGTVIVTALSLAQYDDAVSDFRAALVGGALIVLGFEAVVVWLLTNHLTQPVTRMTETATRVADGALDTQIDPPSGSRETAQLAVDLDRMLRRLRTTLNDSEQSAAEANQARDDMQRFLADVSHELRTPLTALKGYSDLYAGGMLDQPADVDRAMSRIGNESDRLNELVNGMLRLTRQDPQPLLAETFDPTVIVEQVVDDLRAAYPERNIEVTIASGHCEINGDPGQIHQAILNLGSNACQHTNPDVTVTVGTTLTEAEVDIWVADQGPGISKGEAEKIFQPFYRHDVSRSRAGQGGAGLGLALTKQIVDRHNGTLAVRQTLGGGATFGLTLPLTSK